MPRPKFCRKVCCMPGNNYFKPKGIPLAMLAEVILHLDEFEAIRLADYEGLYQEDAAAQMKISRQTFGRIIDSAHKKIAEALIFGKAIKIEGGDFEMSNKRKFQCSDCNHSWEIAFGTGRPNECPECKSKNIHRADDDRGSSRNASPAGGFSNTKESNQKIGVGIGGGMKGRGGKRSGYCGGRKKN